MIIGFRLSPGLWIAGRVDDEIRTSLAFYRSSRSYTEFAPGPYNSMETDSSRFKVYKITSDDLTTPGSDWVNWPDDLGAPLDSLGNPDLIGDQTLFGVYNDSDTSRRILRGGSEIPLYSEVRQLTYAYDKQKYLGDVVYVNYVIENKSDQIWDSIFVGVYADPDMGIPSNDLLGSDSNRSMIYVYSEDYDNDFAGYGYPVVATMMLDGEKIGRKYYEQYNCTNTRPTRYSSFLPNSPQKTIDLLTGMDSLGSPYIDPVSGELTKFPYNGDPRYGVGWIDVDDQDKSTLISRGPYKVRPGEKINLTIAYLAVTGDDMNSALTDMFDLADKTIDWYNHANDGFTLSNSSTQGHIISTDFEPVYQNWMVPESFPSDFAGSGIGKASHLFGSTLDDDDLSSVRIDFSTESANKVYYYDLDDNGWTYIGYLDMPVSAFDLETKRQLNLIYLTEKGSECGNCFLSPRKNPEAVYRLLVTGSTYSENEKTKYVLDNPLADLGDIDLQYLVQFKVDPQSLVYNIQDDQSLTILYDKSVSFNDVDEIDFGESPATFSSSCAAFIASEYKSVIDIGVELSNPDEFSPVQVQQGIDGLSETAVYIDFIPTGMGQRESSLRLYNLDFEEYFYEISLRGEGIGWPLDGDINLNGWLEPSDIAGYLGYLYRDFGLPAIEIQLDLTSPVGVGLDDVIHLINLLFYSQSN